MLATVVKIAREGIVEKTDKFGISPGMGWVGIWYIAN